MVMDYVAGFRNLTHGSSLVIEEDLEGVRDNFLLRIHEGRHETETWLNVDEAKRLAEALLRRVVGRPAAPIDRSR